MIKINGVEKRSQPTYDHEDIREMMWSQTLDSELVSQKSQDDKPTKPSLWFARRS